jgi:hypothetical protein
VDNIIHEFKFCNEISLQDHLQIFLYALIHYQKLKNKSVVLWNFKTCKKYTSTFSKDIKSNAIREYIKDFLRPYFWVLGIMKYFSFYFTNMLTAQKPKSPSPIVFM